MDRRPDHRVELLGGCHRHARRRPGERTRGRRRRDPATAWVSNALQAAVGQWLQVDFDRPVTNAVVTLTPSATAVGAQVRRILIETVNGSTTLRFDEAGKPLTAALPYGETPWVRFTAAATDDGSAGVQFGITDLAITQYDASGFAHPVQLRHTVLVPGPPPGSAIAGWDLGSELLGRPGCAPGPDGVRCAASMALAPEEPANLSRTLTVPRPVSVTPMVWVRPRQGPKLADLIAAPSTTRASGDSDLVDILGSAYAAADGDPATAWTAPQRVVQHKTPPTLTLTLPRPTVVTGLRLAASRSMLPAHPTVVAINLGDGPQVRQLQVGELTTLWLHPRVTDTVSVSLLDWDDVIDRNALGFDQLKPPGLAEVVVLGAGVLVNRWPLPEAGVRSGLAPAERDTAGQPIEPADIDRDIPFQISAVAARSVQGDGGIRSASTLLNLMQQATAVADRTEVLGPIDEAPVSAAPRTSAPNSETYTRRRRNLLIGIGAGAAVLMVALLVLASVLSRIFGDVSGGLNKDELGLNAPTASTSAASSAPPGSVVKPTKVTVFSPDGGADNPGEADLAIDGNPATSWKTDIYTDPVPFPSFKNGVGLMLQLPQATVVGTVAIDVASTGTKVEIRSASTPTPATLEDTAVLTSATALRPGHNTISVEAAAPTSNLLVWISTLGTTDGKSQADISEITIYAAS